ncbi:Calcium-transporting ATPase 8,plasma membrane-type [Trichinella pseudospiralis]
METTMAMVRCPRCTRASPSFTKSILASQFSPVLQFLHSTLCFRPAFAQHISLALYAAFPTQSQQQTDRITPHTHKLVIHLHWKAASSILMQQRRRIKHQYLEKVPCSKASFGWLFNFPSSTLPSLLNTGIWNV